MKKKNKIELVGIVVFFIVASISRDLTVWALSGTEAAQFARGETGPILASKYNIYKYTIDLVPLTFAFTSYYWCKFLINKRLKK